MPPCCCYCCSVQLLQLSLMLQYKMNKLWLRDYAKVWQLGCRAQTQLISDSSSCVHVLRSSLCEAKHRWATKPLLETLLVPPKASPVGLPWFTSGPVHDMLSSAVPTTTAKGGPVQCVHVMQKKRTQHLLRLFKFSSRRMLTLCVSGRGSSRRTLSTV